MWSIGTANFLEIGIILAVVWGLYAATPNFLRARGFRRKLREEGINGINERLARKEVRLHRNICIGLLAILLAGGALALAPPPTNLPITPAGIVIAILLILAAPALGTWSRQERTDSKRIRAEVTEIANGNGNGK